MRRLAVLLGILAFVAAGGARADEPSLGLVLMHGKWGSPQYGIAPVAAAARSAGYLVENIEMPWSEKRNFDADYKEALKEIEAAVARLKAAGATRRTATSKSRPTISPPLRWRYRKSSIG